MVVVEVAEQHGVDVVDVLLNRQVTAPAERADPAAQERVGEDAQAAQLEQHGRVAHPRGAHAVGSRRSPGRVLCHGTTLLGGEWGTMSPPPPPPTAPTPVLPPLHIGRHVVQSPVVLAPMAGITNRAFRRLCREYGTAGLRPVGRRGDEPATSPRWSPPGRWSSARPRRCG